MTDYIKNSITNIPVDTNSTIFNHYNKIIPFFNNQAVYIYSFKESKMLYAKGWFDILGYRDNEISMFTIVSISSPSFAKFSHEINQKALNYINSQNERLEEYSFTIELEKIHKNGQVVPLFSRVGVHKAENGKITEIIGVSQVIESLKFGNIMNYATYGPTSEDFEETLSKELFCKLVISKKEKEALELAAKGYTFKEIASKFNVSQSAIEKRIIPLYKRFDVKSLPHLISFAHINNLF